MDNGGIQRNLCKIWVAGDQKSVLYKDLFEFQYTWVVAYMPTLLDNPGIYRIQKESPGLPYR